MTRGVDPTDAHRSSREGGVLSMLLWWCLVAASLFTGASVNEAPPCVFRVVLNGDVFETSFHIDVDKHELDALASKLTQNMLKLAGTQTLSGADCADGDIQCLIDRLRKGIEHQRVMCTADVTSSSDSRQRLHAVALDDSGGAFEHAPTSQHVGSNWPSPEELRHSAPSVGTPTGIDDGMFTWANVFASRRTTTRTAGGAAEIKRSTENMNWTSPTALLAANPEADSLLANVFSLTRMSDAFMHTSNSCAMVGTQDGEEPTWLSHLFVLKEAGFFGTA